MLQLISILYSTLCALCGGCRSSTARTGIREVFGPDKVSAEDRRDLAPGLWTQAWEISKENLPDNHVRLTLPTGNQRAHFALQKACWEIKRKTNKIYNIHRQSIQANMF